MYELPYYVVNCGDGSAAVTFCQSEDEAAKQDEERQENGDGWGEPSVGTVKLRINNGVLEFEEYEETPSGKYENVWHAVPLVPVKP